MKKSRTVNIAKNSSLGLISQFINLLISFLVRTFFIRYLGVEYLGINGLFTNILMILSFAELGIGNAIVFALYKPLATDDNERIKSLMAVYAKAYKLIGAFIFITGLLVIPFLDVIIKETPNINENLSIIYLLFLFNTASSYLFVYKKTILVADQKNYVVLIYQLIFKAIQSLLQIFVLWLTGSYLLFLIIQIVLTLINNIVVSLKVNNIYSFLNDKEAQPLEKHDQRSILSNVQSLVLYKLGSIVLNGTDNIIISYLIGITAVGLNSNYVLIVSAVSGILGQVMNGFTASVGHLNAIGSSESRERAFDKIFFLSSWIYGFVAVGLMLFINELIQLWIGDSFLFNELIVFSIVLHFYVNGAHFAAYTYRVTMGLFVEGRLAPLGAAILNIILSFYLGSKIGIAGIFFATSISRFLTTGLVDPYLVYKRGFNKTSMKYHLHYFSFAILYILMFFGIRFSLTFFPSTNIVVFIIKVLFTTIVFNLAMIVIFWRSRNFIEIKSDIIRVLKSIS